MNPNLLIVDLFCGAGGTTTGYHQTEGRAKVIACVNHDPVAIQSHWKNYPDVLHFEEDIRTLDLTELVHCARKWQAQFPEAALVLWASLECTNFSKAKGGQPRDADSRTLADHLHRYVTALNPDYIKIENVVEFMSWGPLDAKGKPVSRKNGTDWLRWRREICEHGYRDEWRELNAADFGAYTSRNRLFGIFAKPGLPVAWPQPTHSKKGTSGMFGNLAPWKPVREVLDFSDEGQSIFGRKKPLSDKTLERIFAGLVKYVAGGKDAWLLKYNSFSQKGVHQPPSVDEPCPTVACQSRLGLVQTTFLSKQFSGNPESKNISVEGPAGTITTVDHHALVSTRFLTQYYGNGYNRSVDTAAPTLTTKDRCSLVDAQFIMQSNGGVPSSKSRDVNQPCYVLTCSDNKALVSPCFIVQRNHGNPEYRTVSLDGPARTLTSTAGNQELVSPCFIAQRNFNNTPSGVEEPARTLTTNGGNLDLVFIDKQYGSGPGNQISVDGPAGTITANDHHALISPKPFIASYYSGGRQLSSVEDPAGTIMPIPKERVITPVPFVMPTNFNNQPQSIDAPCGTITANRKWHYLVNPSWGGHASPVNNPAPVLIARQDKAPLYLVNPVSGMIAIQIEAGDSEAMIKVKEFMIIYGIIDIKMRMLKVLELLLIQGFPRKYKLAGTQTDQKKFIGNSVVPVVVAAWAIALSQALYSGMLKTA